MGKECHLEPYWHLFLLASLCSDTLDSPVSGGWWAWDVCEFEVLLGSQSCWQSSSLLNLQSHSDRDTQTGRCLKQGIKNVSLPHNMSLVRFGPYSLPSWGTELALSHWHQEEDEVIMALAWVFNTIQGGIRDFWPSEPLPGCSFLSLGEL